MSLLWPALLVLMCVTALVVVLRPKSAIVKPLGAFTLLGMLAGFVWLTDGRLLGFMLLGIVLAYPLILIVLLRQARVWPVPTSLLVRAGKPVFASAIVFGALIGAGIELGGRWSGSSFVVWRACVGGLLVVAAGVLFLMRATRPDGPK